ncbi:hypothetical protein [Larsenimonas suaedae]|uniref:Secreted protein n=1 Tax=Larsenimonas suaedae TaxID=1851019 RepID=A0ABU1GS49_9GAMM|nr:hypothetical protein [Larsenimonas suaedae]MCM2972359.1 hypothetical protein [Larsenimonas suaedae]MDR5894845.1 hypothetical protein [Larsenimonas suaedae]
MRILNTPLLIALMATSLTATAETVIIQRDHSVSNQGIERAPEHRRDHHYNDRHDNPRGERFDDHHRKGWDHDDRRRYDRDGRPRIDANVLIAPETEHSRSNYVPDNYRLEDYDGKPDRATVCSGQSGRTLSTTNRTCPEGQESAPKGATTYSTSP